LAKAPSYEGLSADLAFDAAGRTIVRALFDETLRAAPAVLRGDDTRAVHDMRVSIRRLRSALKTFRKTFSAKKCRALRSTTRRIGRKLGPVRDADVHLAALRAALAGAAGADRAGIGYALESLAERRRIALAAFAIELSQFDRDAFARALDG